MKQICAPIQIVVTQRSASPPASVRIAVGRFLLISESGAGPSAEEQPAIAELKSDGTDPCKCNWRMPGHPRRARVDEREEQTSQKVENAAFRTSITGSPVRIARNQSERVSSADEKFQEWQPPLWNSHAAKWTETPSEETNCANSLRQSGAGRKVPPKLFYGAEARAVVHPIVGGGEQFEEEVAAPGRSLARRAEGGKNVDGRARRRRFVGVAIKCDIVDERKNDAGAVRGKRTKSGGKLPASA
jgi:hypothetical protein